jgi:hypothetical protein
MVDITHAHANRLESRPQKRPKIPSYLSLRPGFFTLRNQHRPSKSPRRLAPQRRKQQRYHLHPLEHSNLDVSISQAFATTPNILLMKSIQPT